MAELMYDQSTAAIAGALFVSMALAIEVGYRLAVATRSHVSEASKSHINGIQASLLGVLALLLGFTFSLSMQRFDSRSDAVVDEANAIGTTYLRARLLPESVRSNVEGRLRHYMDLRIEAGVVALIEHDQREALLAAASREIDEIWSLAIQAGREDPNPVTSGLFIQALNEMIDSYGRRDAVLNRHVPEAVLLLLYFTFLMTGTLVGYASGVSGHRTSFATYILVALIVLLVFIIVDLDRPRRGLIEVDQKSMTDLHRTMSVPLSDR